jgi:hypothetical protein
MSPCNSLNIHHTEKYLKKVVDLNKIKIDLGEIEWVWSELIWLRTVARGRFL